MKYISLGEWFDEGTEAILLDDIHVDVAPQGIFEGYHDGELDEELCTFDEFDIYDEDGVLIQPGIKRPREPRVVELWKGSITGS